jgi:hypothetical protein
MRNRNKIKHEKTVKFINLLEHLSLDLGMYQVKAALRLSAERIDTAEYEVYNVDVDDVELMFYIDGKSCQYEGFKELYEKLFGSNSYQSMVNNLCKDFEDHAIENCTYPRVEDLSKHDLKVLFYDVLSRVETSMYGKMEYADDFAFLNIARLIYPHAIQRIEAPWVNSESGRSYDHQVVNLNLINQ